MEHDDIRKTVEEASRGHEPSIDRLLCDHISRLHAYLRLHAGGVVRKKESAHDLVQSVCREVLEDLSGFEYRGEAAFRHWLFTKARRKILDKNRFYRRECRDAAREAGRPTGGADSDDAAARNMLDYYGTLCTPSRDASAREQLARFEQAFDDLPDEYKEVITLARIVSLPHREIAARMGRSEIATRHLLSRALAKLSSKLVRRP